MAKHERQQLWDQAEEAQALEPALIGLTIQSRYSSLSIAPSTSSSASATTLPISCTIVRTSSSFRAARPAQHAFSSDTRSSNGQRAQVSWASRARAIAAATAEGEEQGTRATTAPVEGLRSTMRLEASMMTPWTMVRWGGRVELSAVGCAGRWSSCSAPVLRERVGVWRGDGGQWEACQ